MSTYRSAIPRAYPLAANRTPGSPPLQAARNGRCRATRRVAAASVAGLNRDLELIAVIHTKDDRGSGIYGTPGNR
jgi:hypothetical protein